MEAFLITFRESLEAAVIVGLIFSILKSLGKKEGYKYVWFGVGAGVLGSLIFAWIFSKFWGGFEGKTEKVYEGILMIAAALLITHMVFWMKKKAKILKKHISEKVEGYISSGSIASLFFLTFFSVIREGVETVIFFQAIDTQSNTGISIIGGIIGVVLAIGLAVLLQRLTRNVAFKTFFSVTGILLLFIAAGLVAHGIVEFQGANWIPTFIKPIWDTSAILSEKEGLGSFLKALFGYDANPSLLAVIGYILFLIFAFRKWRK